jgi:hypothetical protein
MGARRVKGWVRGLKRGGIGGRLKDRISSLFRETTYI